MENADQAYLEGSQTYVERSMLGYPRRIPDQNIVPFHLNGLPASQITRRKFLQNIAGAVCALPLAKYAFSATPDRSCIVVGAGLAGLVAALRLKNAGWKVTVLEARQRAGGRVWSYNFPQAPKLVCELGGEWIGKDHLRMLSICKEMGLAVEPHAYKLTLLSGDEVKRPGQWQYSQTSRDAWSHFVNDYKRYRRIDLQNLDRYDWWTWLKKIGFTEEDLRIREVIDSTDSGESIRQLSAFTAAQDYVSDDYMDPQNTDQMDFHIVNGNGELVRALVARLAPGELHLDSAVTHIRERAGMITVTTVTQNFTADACIFTAPATVLSTIEFDPPLSSAQRLAADELEYARIIKTQILFDRRFWGEENFALMSDETSHFYFHATQNQPGTLGILCSYAVGDKADVLAAQSVEHRRELILRDLAAISPDAGAAAVDIHTQAWQRDPYVHGAYAIYRPGQWFRLRPLLMRPHGKILFAGEHLAECQGFMEGAVVTGETAAHHLLT